MLAGRLRHRITLEAPSETAGDAVVTWTPQATVWAEMEGLTGINRGGLTAEAEHRLRIRYRPTVNVRWRVGFGDRKLRILSVVDPTGRRRELVLMTQEWV